MESSRKTELGTPLALGGCPRCGTRLGEPYKYCPNCAYRLRPDVVPMAHVAVAAPPVSQRLVALGGYLLFAAMLLLVVFAGVRLFAQPERAQPALPRVIRTRDPGCLALTLDEFVEVPAGTAFWGLYDPGRDMYPVRVEAAAEEKRAAETAASAIATLAEEALADLDEARRNLEEQVANGDPEAVQRWTEAVAGLEEALADLHDAISSHASAPDAIRSWADALAAVVPHEPVAGIPDPYEVEVPFRMARREVTNDQYFEFLRAWARKTGKPVPKYLVPDKWKRRTGSRDVKVIYNEREGDFPVVGIPFDAALEFCGWFWEERLRADPDVAVDLPTWKEYLLAARGDLTCNFPWGRRLDEAKEKPNLGTSQLWSVVQNRREDEFYGGFLDLVGNAAEWIYNWNDEAVAAGLSYEDEWIYKVHEGEPGQPGRMATPFSTEAFRVIPHRQSRSDVGFRPVIRRAPQLPSFVAIAAGGVRLRECPEGLVPPERLDVEGPEGERGERETLEQILAGREPKVAFASGTEEVKRGFDIAATEITNRQYLAFLAAIAPSHTKDDVRLLVPKGWRRDNMLVRLDEEDTTRLVARAYDGYYGVWASLEHLYVPGQENVPVQGVTAPQAEKYAAWLSSRLGCRCTLPTVGQYLRAGRGDAVTPYPWGDDPTDPELAPCYRPEADPRAFALFPTDARPVVGLAGNVAELVKDQSGRLLLAGGFYELPARFATLDCFLDAGWDTVQFVVEPEDLTYDEESDPGDPLRPRLSAPRTLKYFTGFRVVRLPDPF